MPTQKWKNGFSSFSSQEIGSSLISFGMIFEALQSNLSRFKFHLLSSEILKILEIPSTSSYKVKVAIHRGLHL